MLNTGAGARPFPFTVIEATGHRKQTILVWQSYGINRGETGGSNLCCYVVRGGPNHKPVSDERC